jgi:predicted transposase/invertase (TIGR01784 family)
VAIIAQRVRKNQEKLNDAKSETTLPAKKGRGQKLADIELMPLKNDAVFKMLFGDSRYIDLLRSFLLVTLDIPEEEYAGLEIIDPHTERDSVTDKQGILDVRIQLTNKKIISVEIQVHPIPSMAERITFYTSRNLFGQISPGKEYFEIARVVTIVILNYDLIPQSPRYHHIFRLYDSENKVLFTDVMEIHALELRKLPEAPGADAKEEELLNWLRLIKSERKDEIEMLATKTPAMGKAVARLKQLSADERARLLYEARELALMDERTRIKGARIEGREEGREEGLEEGRKEGREEGRKEGEREKALEMARNLLACGVDVDIIAESSGLPLDEIKAIRL